MFPMQPESSARAEFEPLVFKVHSYAALVSDLRASHVLLGAGHWLQQERAVEVSEKIVGFLKEIGGA